VRSRTLFASLSFSDLNVYNVPISDGMSNCCACSKIHLDRCVQELSRRSSKALDSSSECEFECPNSADDDVNSLDKLGLVSDAAFP
jgi:hypothetical protein